MAFPKFHAFYISSLFILFIYFVCDFSYDEATGTMDTGYPRSIEEDFPGIQDEVDAAVFQYGITKTTKLKTFSLSHENRLAAT